MAAASADVDESTAKRQEMVDAMSKMLLSGDDDDVSDVGQLCMTETGILLTDGQYFELYSPNTNTTQLLDIEMQKRYYGFVMEVLSDGRVMVAGGTTSVMTIQPAPTVIIDLVSKQVTQGPPMTTGRCSAASAMIGGEMYVCGGWDEECNDLASCEVYRNGQWIPIAAMKVPRSGHAVVPLGGLLYAISGDRMRTAVESYSPDTNSWQLVSPLNEPRHLLSAAVFGPYIYAAGAFKGAKFCERCCPGQNQWETVAPMNKGRHSFSLVPFGNKLYAVGAVGGMQEKTVESYDTEKNEWKIQDITLKKPCEKAVVVNYQAN